MLQVVATHLPPEEIEGIRQMFMDMDRDGSGTISFLELKEGWQHTAHYFCTCFFHTACVVLLIYKLHTQLSTTGRAVQLTLVAALQVTAALIYSHC